MKNKAIALVLCFVMVFGAFNMSGCTLLFVVKAKDFEEGFNGFFLGLLMDICVILGGYYLLKSVEVPNETETYLAGAGYSFTDYYSLMEKLSEEEIAAMTDKLNSLPDAKLAALTETVYSLPQTEIAASIERFNALSEAELASVVREFNALSEADFDTLADKLKERLLSPAAEYVAALTRDAYSFALAR
jgi:hypothetical protein